jgi:3-dehydroquinate synthase
MIVSNETVAPLYLDIVLASLKEFQVNTVIIPDGEQYKNLDTLNIIYDALLKNHFDRDCTLLALGGGVVGDITGFAAATYQRGVNFIQVPTTLLAQVDSSVGGKTGVNHSLGKNMIGAFYQPLCVLADTSTLNTLDDRQLSAGIAEVIKYGLIRDIEFYHWLEINMEKLLQRDSSCTSYVIEQSCLTKADIVAADELEGGIRAILNYGHTFGHAIEAGMGYGAWLHGEAIAAGMVMASDLSVRLGFIKQSSASSVEKLFTKAHLPTRAPQQMTANQLLEKMAVDKKVKQGKINLVLLKKLGDAFVTQDYSPELLMETLNQHLHSPELSPTRKT